MLGTGRTSFVFGNKMSNKIEQIKRRLSRKMFEAETLGDEFFVKVASTQARLSPEQASF